MAIGARVKRSPMPPRKHPMKRTGFRRKAPMRATSRRNSYARRERFIDHMIWVKTQPCAAIGMNGHVCDGAIEADHAGVRGMGRKCPDFECIPLCKRAHDERPGRRGAFALLSKEDMRAWVQEAIRLTLWVAMRESPDRAAIAVWWMARAS